MSRVHRIRRRRASDSSATHERARGLSSERLDTSLEPADRVWLDEHLVGCDACRSVAAAYAADRAALMAVLHQLVAALQVGVDDLTGAAVLFVEVSEDLVSVGPHRFLNPAEVARDRRQQTLQVQVRLKLAVI